MGAGGGMGPQLNLNDIGRNCLLGNRKKIAKFLMRTFTCRSTFLYGKGTWLALNTCYHPPISWCGHVPPSSSPPRGGYFRRRPLGGRCRAFSYSSLVIRCWTQDRKDVWVIRLWPFLPPPPPSLSCPLPPSPPQLGMCYFMHWEITHKEDNPGTNPQHIIY